MSEEDNFDIVFVTSVTNARLLAMEYMMHVLIASHPDPTFVEAMWNHSLPEQLDLWQSEPGYKNNEVFRESLHDQLSKLTSFVNREARSAK